MVKYESNSPSKKTSAPKFQFFNNTKLYLVMDSVNQPDDMRAVGALNVVGDIATYIIIRFDEATPTDTCDSITEFDKAVLDAVCTLYENGNREFTARDVSKVLIGKYNINHYSETLIDKVIDTLYRMSHILVSIDCKKEFDIRNIDASEAEALAKPSYMLEMESKYYVSSNGKKVTGYKLCKEPPLMTYAKATKQYITVPSENFGLAPQNTEACILLNRYLIKRIMQIQNPNSKIQNKISYQWWSAKHNRYRGAFTVIGTPSGVRETFGHNWGRTWDKWHECVISLLDEYTSHKIISGYEISYSSDERPDGVVVHTKGSKEK